MESKEQSYFNTTNERGSQLEQSIEKAERQEDIVLELFKKHIVMSPSQVHHFFDDSTPLTSIRRAITVLTDKSILVKTDQMIRGVYGKNEHCYKLAAKVTMDEITGGFKSDMLSEMIERYRNTGWHMFDSRKFDSIPKDEIKELVRRGFIKIREGINRPIFELCNPAKYRSVE